ncbi:hypothetical protein LSCM1_00562 [Leishmania martiniquensis]|uniref:Protein kinase domain-containing protein n=1 Tax=Leishmania martiniquensis TaxID=1580590 RepID=A0A836G309_9TRYP|nr:hypothetical protein LSCM1_00562 [Leishmania martiniquensis]
MGSIFHEAPRVQEAILENHLQAFYIAPQPPYPHSPGARRERCSMHKAEGSSSSSPLRVHVEFPPPAVPHASTATPHDPPSAFSPSRLLPALSECMTAAQRKHRLPRSATEEAAAAAAHQTLARLQAAQPTASARHFRQVRSLPLEAWQPLPLTEDPLCALRQPVTSVSSPLHSEFSAPFTSLPTTERGSAEAEGPEKISLRWQLRRGRHGAPPFSQTSGKGNGPESEHQQHPLQTLHLLGSGAFNDSPLGTFLPRLNLRMPSCRVSTAAQASEEEAASRPSLRLCGREHTRTRRIRSRVETLTVHVGDVEARTYRVEVAQGEASPLQSLLKAYADCVWDGSEFLLIPLLDEQRESIEGQLSSIGLGSLVRLRDADEESDTVAAAMAPPIDCERDGANDALLPDMTTTFLRSANASFSCAGGGGGTFLDTSPPPSSLGSTSVGGGGSRVSSTVPAACSAIGVPARSIATTVVPMVPRWKCFSTTAALYLTLGEAGCCDVANFPYAAIQLCSWDDLVGQQRVRIEIKASCSADAIHALKKETRGRRARLVPVAVMFPMCRKGVMRCPLSLATQPFTDAEVFQLFYLQLLFRACFDIRFRGMTFTVPGQVARHLRSDLIAVRSSGGRPVAFEHPTNDDEWLLFPARTRLLTLLNLEEAVVPLYATPTELQETSSLPLFGAGENLPCLGVSGRDAAQWAATVEVSSPETAVVALTALFDLMKTHFGCTRGELWRHANGNAHAGASTFAPLLFRCSEFTAGASPQLTRGVLFRFFVSLRRLAAATAAASAVPATDAPPSGDVVPASASSGALFPSIQADELSHTTKTRAASFVSTPPSLTVIEPRPETSTTMETLTENLFDAGSLRENRDDDQGKTEAIASALDPIDLGGTHSLEGAPRAFESVPPLPVHALSVDATASAVSTQSPHHCSALVSTADAAEKTGTEGPDALPAQVSTDAQDADMGEATTANSELPSASSRGPWGPSAKRESLATRWRDYVQTGNCSLFHGTATDVEVLGFLGRGGSGLVYRGTYGSRRLPVAVKVFVSPDGMTHEQYVRESLTDVAFYVLMNQLADFKVCYGGRAHDFIVSHEPPKGLPAEAVAEALRGGRDATTRLCYLVTDLMDGTLGRFLTENDAGFDPVYDQLLNSPLRDGELFQFLFIQLTIKTLFDWKILDMMLNNQLRGDNIGYRYVSRPPAHATYLRDHPEEAAVLAESRQCYAGILYCFQFGTDEPLQYLRFPADVDLIDHGKPDPLRFICMIDIGQGMQPNVTELVLNGYIGRTILDTCIEDDGFGRYWPLNELYCRYVDVEGTLAKDVAAWASARRVTTQEDAFHALRELFDHFYPHFGVESPTEMELQTYLCLSWTCSNLEKLKAAYVYRAA